MKIATFKIHNKIGLSQPLKFQFAPRQGLGVFPGLPGPTLKFLVDPKAAGKTCQCWVNNESTDVQGSSLGTCDGGKTFVTSDCFG